MVQEKRKLKPGKSSSSPSKLLLKRKRMSQLMAQENLTPEEKQQKKEQMKAQEEIDRQVCMDLLLENTRLTLTRGEGESEDYCCIELRVNLHFFVIILI